MERVWEVKYPEPLSLLVGMVTSLIDRKCGRQASNLTATIGVKAWHWPNFKSR